MYKIAERFKSVQGEGVYAGTPMAFIRFVGCSVGKTICQHCDTDFEKVGTSFRGGGELSGDELLEWARPYRHVCLTGGEPLDQNLEELLVNSLDDVMFHVETSGTKPVRDFLKLAEACDIDRGNIWICVSPKPGFLEAGVSEADEIKVIVPGLGTMTSAAVDSRIRMLKGEGYQCGPGEFEDYVQKLRWPTLEDALRWAEKPSVPVFLQPRNGKFDIDHVNLMYVQDVLREYPQLRLSVQMHKILKVQ